MKIKAEAKIRWDKDQAKWERRQAKWDARQAKWEARQAHYQERQAHWGERQAHWDKSREEWDQIGKLAMSALSLAATAGIAGIRRLQHSEQPESEPAAERNPAVPAPSESIAPAVLGAVMILTGLLWLLLSKGGALFGSLLFCAVLIAVLAAVFAAVVRWSEQNPSAEGRRAAAAPLHQTNTTVDRSSPAADAPASVVHQAAERLPTASSQLPATPQPARVPAAAPLASKIMSVLQPMPAEVKRDRSYYRRRAKDYRLRIQRILKNRRRGPLTDAMSSAAQSVQRWEERVGQLADRLATFEKDGIIQRDIREVPRDITRLSRLSETETDPEIRKQMARTLSCFEAQQGLLDTLVRLMRRTRLQLDDTLAAMGTIYSQVQVLDAMDIASAKTTRIAEEIDEQVNRLNDLLSALGDAYGSPSSSDASEAPEAVARRIQPGHDQAAG